MKQSDHKIYNELLSQLLRDEKWEVRANAAHELGKIIDGRATHILTKALQKEKDDVVINRIIEAMGNSKDKKATMIIIDYLKEELNKTEDKQDKNRLFVIVEALMKIGDKRALEHIGMLKNSCYEDIRKLTFNAFDCIDPKWKTNVKGT